ncbi:hypothetical protein C8J57DRAFT_1067132 [Mycena rebaudengoi]|nr:hypothetical protein C8J57DRAFT_1067132 [Mycena rebaudengoi]
MRRIEAEDRLRSERAQREQEVRAAEVVLRSSESRCRTLEEDLENHKRAERTRLEQENSNKKACRDEGRDEMMLEVMRLLSLKREEERKARQTEKDQLAKEFSEKIMHEAEAKRKAEQKLGAERERSRCLKRDQKYMGAFHWTPQLAFERFEEILVVEEFSKCKFSDSTPLIFEALPWPTLDKPWAAAGMRDITSAKVHAFFASSPMVRVTCTAYPTPGEYKKYLIKQGLLVFHGDKIVNRMSTVADATLKERILAAANIVTQTLNDLMQRSG